MNIKKPQRKLKRIMIKKNDEFYLEITGYTSEGGGVGKKDGMTVFVENTAKGDTVLCHVIKAKKTYAVGKAFEIKKKSTDRISPDCEVFSSCGGCSFCHIKYEAELTLKEEKVKAAFERIAHLSPELESITPSPKTEHYRNKAQYPVRRNNGVLEIGFFAKKSHRVVNGDDCHLQPPEFSKITNIVRRWINTYNIPVYSELSGSGLLRHIFLRKAEETGEIAVCLVINGNNIPFKDELLNELKGVSGFKTLVLNVNKEISNVILGEKIIPVYGDGTIEDILLGIKIKISPLSFYQVNKSCTELLYKKVGEYLGQCADKTVLDLYCGTGTIGLTQASRVKTLIGVEIVPAAIEDAKKNAEINDIKNAEFICGDAGEAAKALSERGVTPDAVIIDPPRKGADDPLLNTVAKMNPEKIVYVSCDPATLARDCSKLTALGYTVKKAAPFDMFPRTAHVETVVQLVRKTPDTHTDFEICLDEVDLHRQNQKQLINR